MRNHAIDELIELFHTRSIRGLFFQCYRRFGVPIHRTNFRIVFFHTIFEVGPISDLFHPDLI